jgi:site-specific DNA-cytosine methylase
MNLVSYYDGMSCGQIALDKLGVRVDNYFAYEIDKYAIEIAKKNYPNTKQMGSVLDVDFESLPEIDLLIGGSPCQGFSTAGKQLNFEDPRSKLFFEFVKAKDTLKPKYWMLENVGMKKEFRDIISKYLGCEPIHINSSKLTAQNRPRYYWTNIPNPEQPKDKGLTTEYVLGIKEIGQMQAFPRDYNKLGLKRAERFESRTDGKSNCCLARSDKNLYKTDKGIKKLTANDYEKLQTVPLNYTEGVSNTQRYRMLGNGWTVDVIAHIFSKIPQM